MLRSSRRSFWTGKTRSKARALGPRISLSAILVWPECTTSSGRRRRARRNIAEARGLVYRLIRIDRESYMPYPDDIRDDRVCIEIDNGKVSKAKIT